MSKSRSANAKRSIEPKALTETNSSKRLMSLSGFALLGILMLVVWVSTSNSQPQPALELGGTSLLGYSIVQTYPHDPNAFTQGLEYDTICNSTSCQDIFWESTGLYGKSTVREVDALTGSVLRQQALPASDFGEGLVKFGSRLFQLTWLSGKTYFYDIHNFSNFTMQIDPLSDGWGATTDGRHLIVSDGTATLTFLDPDTLSKMKSIVVSDNGSTVPMLNELEYINEEIWANVWMTECIAKIDPRTGDVRGWVVFTGLRDRLVASSPPQQLPIDVLNGIAWDSVGERLFITGKCWRELYEVKPEVIKLQMSAAEHLEVQKMCRVAL
ncbi:hypothetical protein ABBQ38_012739 [Trebouxia sp. C0009 RCD-2024]